MSENGSAKTRLFPVTAGNLRNSHLYICRHYDFFPKDCIGPPRKNGTARNSGIEISLDGLKETVATDIGTNAATGRPRGFFRGRAWARKFFEYHNVRAGDVLGLERVSTRHYRLSPPNTRLADIIKIKYLLDDDPHWWNKKRADYFMNQMIAKLAMAC